jgi:uncharacterized membrane protein
MFKETLGIYRNFFKLLSIDAWLLIFFVPITSIGLRRFFYQPSFYYYFLVPAAIIVLIVYIFFDYRCHQTNLSMDKVYKKKIFLVIVLISIFLVGYLFVSYKNSKKQVMGYTHDEIILTEYAMRNLLQGRNPYVESYFNTPLAESYSKIYIVAGYEVFNPALLHYAYLPAQFILPIPVYLLLLKLFHWYDHRIFYFFCILGILFILFKLVKDYQRRLLLLIIFFFNFYFLFYSYYGFNDLQILFLLLACLYFLKKQKILISSIFLGLAIASKQTAIIFIPFYLLYIFKQGDFDWKSGFKRLFLPVFLLIFTAALIIIPFVVWNKAAFIDDVFNYQNGKSLVSCPINGWGFSYLIYQMHQVKSVFEYYPFLVWQVLIVAPLVIFLLIRQLKENNLKRLVLNYALSLLVFWFFSRYFLSGHLIYISSFLPIAYFIEPQKS